MANLAKLKRLRSRIANSRQGAPPRHVVPRARLGEGKRWEANGAEGKQWEKLKVMLRRQRKAAHQSYLSKL